MRSAAAPRREPFRSKRNPATPFQATTQASPTRIRTRSWSSISPSGRGDGLCQRRLCWGLGGRRERYDEDWEYYESSKEVCPECDHFYGISVTPGYVCDIPQGSFAYRALDIQEDGTVDLLYWSGSEDAYVVFAERGSIEGTTLYYEYDWDYYDTPLRYEGRVLFEELESED